MNRITILNDAISKLKANTYLEIGVDIGNCFLKIKAPVKYGVDPRIRIPLLRKFKYFFKNSSNFNNKYYNVTSDGFFEKHSSELTNGIDVSLIDGLHTYDQTVKDVNNVLNHLNDKGIIILHDCNPLSYAANYPIPDFDTIYKLPGYAGVWNGDVWKTIVELRSTRDDLNVCVLNCDHGLGVVVKGKAESKLNFTKEQIRNMEYKDLEANRNEFLNLKSPEYIHSVIKSLQS